MTKIRGPPEFCPMHMSHSIAPTGQEKVLTSPPDVLARRVAWRCEVCGREWCCPRRRQRRLG